MNHANRLPFGTSPLFLCLLASVFACSAKPRDFEDQSRDASAADAGTSDATVQVPRPDSGLPESGVGRGGALGDGSVETRGLGGADGGQAGRTGQPGTGGQNAAGGTTGMGGSSALGVGGSTGTGGSSALGVGGSTGTGGSPGLGGAIGIGGAVGAGGSIGSDGGPSACGNGKLDTSEDCDPVLGLSLQCATLDAQFAAGMVHCNAVSCRYDTASCRAIRCGDGLKEGSEQCDEGTANSDTSRTCTSRCTVPACGNGRVEGTEQCDNGAANSEKGACRTDCVRGVCGDGRVIDGVEECDDGNVKSFDGCDSSCRVESHCVDLPASLCSKRYCYGDLASAADVARTACELCTGHTCSDVLVQSATDMFCDATSARAMAEPANAPNCQYFFVYAGSGVCPGRSGDVTMTPNIIAYECPASGGWYKVDGSYR